MRSVRCCPYQGGGRQDTDLGLCLFCIPGELVMDHLGKRVSAVFQPDLSCLIVRVCQHLEAQAHVYETAEILHS